MTAEVRQDEVPGIIDAHKMYVVVRADLPEGLRAAQAAHAVADMCLLNRDQAIEWNLIPNGNYLIILEVPDEDSLIDWYNYVGVHRIHREFFREPDLQFEATAFAALPHPSMNDVFSPLPLAFPPRPLTWRQRLNRALRSQRV